MTCKDINITIITFFRRNAMVFLGIPDSIRNLLQEISAQIEKFLDIDSDFRYKIIIDKHSLSDRSLNSCKKQ